MVIRRILTRRPRRTNPAGRSRRPRAVTGACSNAMPVRCRRQKRALSSELSAITQADCCSSSQSPDHGLQVCISLVGGQPARYHSGHGRQIVCWSVGAAADGERRARWLSRPEGIDGRLVSVVNPDVGDLAIADVEDLGNVVVKLAAQPLGAVGNQHHDVLIVGKDVVQLRLKSRLSRFRGTCVRGAACRDDLGQELRKHRRLP